MILLHEVAEDYVILAKKDIPKLGCQYLVKQYEEPLISITIHGGCFNLDNNQFNIWIDGKDYDCEGLDDSETEVDEDGDRYVAL